MKPKPKSHIGVELRMSAKRYGFHWFGRDKTGLSRWEGDKSALPWGALALYIIAGLELAVGLVLSLMFRQYLTFGLLTGSGIVLIGLGAWMRRLHHRLTGLMSLQQVADVTGADPDELSRWAEAKALKPSAMVNDEYLYDPSLFEEDATLLRPAPKPESVDLLRPASSATVDDQTLLHPVGPDSDESSKVVEETVLLSSDAPSAPPQAVDAEEQLYGLNR